MNMEGFDATQLADRLSWEQQDYWLHVETSSPLEKYPAKQHARRVAEKLGVEHGLISLSGALARTNEDSDMPAPFRQRRYFYYISGCNEPNCHVTYDIQHDTLTLFIPRINPARVIWNGRGSTPAEARQKYDIDTVLYVDQAKDFISHWLEHFEGGLYILHPNHLRTASAPKFVDSTSLKPAMDMARVIKDDHEIKLIKKANDISSQAHKEVLANILRFKNEAQVEGLFLNVCISQQAKQQAYDPIAASGPNAGTLHYDANNEDFEDRELMCLDAGCEYQLYASDITRTFPLSGNWPSKESKQIYRLVQRMQESCIEKLAPGVRYLDLHILAHFIAIDGLLSLGILHNGTREEIYKAGTSKAFFPHGLGHHVGLEVHDVGHSELMSASEKAPSLYPQDFHLPVYDPSLCRSPVEPQSGHLEEGMVVTVEPGIYFSKYALTTFYLPSPIHSKYINVPVLANYLPVGGVRIEDDILITSKGYENLTTAPKGEAMLEIIRSGNASWPSVKTGAAVRAASVAKKAVDEDEPLLRAPGISRDTPEPVLKPVGRASTAPVLSEGTKAVDLEPFDGPSLFSNFKRACTIDVAGKSANPAKPTAPVPICGDNNTSFSHTYVNSVTGYPFRGSSPRGIFCVQCQTLAHAMARLEQATYAQHGGPRNLNSLPESAKQMPPVAASTKNTNMKVAQLRPHSMDPKCAIPGCVGVHSEHVRHHDSAMKAAVPSTDFEWFRRQQIPGPVSKLQPLGINDQYCIRRMQMVENNDASRHSDISSAGPSATARLATREASGSGDALARDQLIELSQRLKNLESLVRQPAENTSQMRDYSSQDWSSAARASGSQQRRKDVRNMPPI